MYGADPRLFPLGTERLRRIFAEEVRHPAGFEDLHSLEEVVDALARLRAASPGAGQALVKLNEGVSGGGNALVDLGGLPRRARRGSRRRCASGPGPCASSSPRCRSTGTWPSWPSGAASSRS